MFGRKTLIIVIFGGYFFLYLPIYNWNFPYCEIKPLVSMDLEFIYRKIWHQGYKTFYMLNSNEFCWHFNIYLQDNYNVLEL